MHIELKVLYYLSSRIIYTYQWSQPKVLTSEIFSSVHTHLKATNINLKEWLIQNWNNFEVSLLFTINYQINSWEPVTVNWVSFCICYNQQIPQGGLVKNPFVAHFLFALSPVVPFAPNALGFFSLFSPEVWWYLIKKQPGACAHKADHYSSRTELHLQSLRCLLPTPQNGKLKLHTLRPQTLF